MVKCLIGTVLLWLGARLVKLGFKMSSDGGYIDIRVEKRVLAEEIAVCFMWVILSAMMFFMALFVF